MCGNLATLCTPFEKIFEYLTLDSGRTVSSSEKKVTENTDLGKAIDKIKWRILNLYIWSKDCCIRYLELHSVHIWLIWIDIRLDRKTVISCFVQLLFLVVRNECVCADVTFGIFNPILVQNCVITYCDAAFLTSSEACSISSNKALWSFTILV